VRKAFEAALAIQDYLEEHLKPGSDCAELFAGALDAAGVDAIEVSGGTPASGECNPLRRGIDSPEREAYNLPLAQAIKPAVRCPVVVVGGIRSYWSARGIVPRGDADLVARCRPLVCEPDLPQRWRRAEENTLTRCLSCNGCFKAALRGSLACSAPA
jgi:2,4-dienoyl-CoA reductase-like NADH-dependent reductase (Old Yellow Enzyme family)